MVMMKRVVMKMMMQAVVKEVVGAIPATEDSPFERTAAKNGW